MKTKHKRGLLAILVATTALLIFFSGTAVSQEIPVEEKISTLEPAIENDFEKPLPTIKLYAKHLVTEQWGVHEWNSFDAIITKESGWCHTRWNTQTDCPDVARTEKMPGASNAQGLCQTMLSVHGLIDDYDFMNNPKRQIEWCINYIANHRNFSTPSQALAFHISNGHF